MAEKYKREYSGPYQSLESIWNILRLYSSEENPLTVQEIYDHLKRTEDTPPSPQRLKRLLTQESGALQTLYPTLELREDKAPSYSTIDNHLKRILTHGGSPTYPLCCVAHRRRWNGEVKTIPYEDIEECGGDDEGRKNNVPRRYYLKGPLPQGGWRFLSDFVRDCPHITGRQTGQLLDFLDLLVQPIRPRASWPLSPKPSHSQVLALAEQIDRAIQARKTLLVTVGHYELIQRGGRLVPVLRPAGGRKLAPYALMWSGGRYWLVGREEDWTALRLDRLLRLETLEESFTPQEDFDLADCRTDFAPSLPGTRRVVRLRCSPERLGDVAELLGPGAQYSSPRPDGSFEVMASANLESVKTLALRQPDGVEVLEPDSLRRELLQIFRRGAERYGP